MFQAAEWEDDPSNKQTDFLISSLSNNKKTISKDDVHKIKKNKLLKSKDKTKTFQKRKLKKIRGSIENYIHDVNIKVKDESEENNKVVKKQSNKKDNSLIFNKKLVKIRDRNINKRHLIVDDLPKGTPKMKRSKAEPSDNTYGGTVKSNSDNISKSTVAINRNKPPAKMELTPVFRYQADASKGKNLKKEEFQKFRSKSHEIFKPNKEETESKSPKKRNTNMTLRERMMERIKAAKFRYLNEQMYTSDGNSALHYFKNDPDSYRAYHEGYRQQLAKWSLNPLDIIIRNIKRMPEHFVIADFGCGEAKLAKAVKQKVHSFDLVALDDCVQVCDMAHVPLKNATVDVVVFCLSLMGTNLKDYLLEANRVLKTGGIMKIVEVESRFESVEKFSKELKQFAFLLSRKDLSHNLFYFMDFKKKADIDNKKKLHAITLKPCMYKKR